MTVGYSGTPLSKKLGFAPGIRAVVLSAPDGFADLLEPLPDGVSISRRLGGPHQLALIFVTRRVELVGRLPAIRQSIAPDGMIWVAWPKRLSKVPTDITENVIREVALPTGLVDVKVCAIDDTWSGLKLVIRKGLR
jgi:hypothetical protein